MNDSEQFDFIIIGGGFFGCYLALLLRELRPDCSLAIVEREADLLTRASYHNQARIHGGYHYPRSLLTAYRSRVNFPRFVADFPECVDSSFEQYYAIGRLHSRVTAAQFRTFCERIGAPLFPAPEHVRELFDPRLVENVYRVEEYAFDASALKHLLQEQLGAQAISVRLGCEAGALEQLGSDRLAVHVTDQESQRQTLFDAKHVFVCTYSHINTLLAASGIQEVNLKQELTEIALLEMPLSLRGLGITIMDGPFFSAMPFPARRCHSLYHVRYSRHASWVEPGTHASTQEILEGRSYRSKFPEMMKDAERYSPVLADATFLESSWEVRTLLPVSEVDDSRPILFKRDVGGIRNLVCVLGGKIDNVYDLKDQLKEYL